MVERVNSIREVKRMRKLRHVWSIERIKSALIIALPGSGGVLSVLAERIGVNYNTFKLWSAQYPWIDEMRVDARNMMVDVAETKLFEMVEDGQDKAVFFALKMLGKDRGYVERVEQDLSGKLSHDTVLKVEVKRVNIDEAQLK